MNRQILSIMYASGNGLEIAPFHNPWPTHPGISEMHYMDLYTAFELRQQYPEFAHSKIVETTIIDDCQTCEKIPDNSFDFVFSSHVLEHCPNVIQTLETWLRVVKVGGYVIMAIPLKNNPIDKDREVTPFHHFFDEYKWPEILEQNLEKHYREFCTVVDKLSGEELDKKVSYSLITRPHIHFHCWDYKSLNDMFTYKYENRIIHFTVNDFEAFVVLKKDRR